MALGNYKAVLKQAWAGSAFYNMFNFCDQSSAGLNDSEDIANYFESDILPEINNFQHSGIQNIQLYVYNTTTGMNSYTLFLGGAGSRSLSGTARGVAYNTYSFRWTVNTVQAGTTPPLIKRGYNRFVGVVDDDVTDGRIISSWAATYQFPLENILTTPFAIGGATYEFVIHRPGALWAIAPVTGCSGVKLGSQNTRKL